jgi:hypothetical protein
MANKTIGMVRCPLSGELAAVRKDRRGAFYYISAAGRIAPSTDFGQEWFLANATIWGEGGTPPANCPEWIAQGKSWPPATRSRIRGLKPAASRSPGAVGSNSPPPGKPAATAPQSPAREDETRPATVPSSPAGGKGGKPRSSADLFKWWS